MGQNQSSPNSIDYTSNPHLPNDLNNRLNALQYDNSVLSNKQQPTLKKSSSLIEYAPSKEKQLFRDDMTYSYIDYSEARISSTTLKTKRSSTVKLCLMSQDRRRSEDFDMGQMEENIDVLKKNSNFSENNPCLDSTLSPNAVALRTRRKNQSRHPKNSSFFLSSSQTSSVVTPNNFKQEPKAIGPHFSDKVGERLPGKDVDEDVEAVLRTETNDREIDLTHKELHYTESSLCRMESVGCPAIVEKYKENKHIDDEVRILETCGSRLSSPGNVPTGRYSPELHLDLSRSRKKSSIKKEENRYASRPIMIASFEGDNIASYRVKDSELMSLSSSELDHADAGHMQDANKNYSPEKTLKSFKSLNRKDGEYQEVEFSFKPNSLSKGSRRYTTEGSVGVAEPKHHRFLEEQKKSQVNNEADLDNENPLIQNLDFHSLEFASLQPSVEKTAPKFLSCKSSTNNAFRDFENTRYTQDKDAEVLMESKTLTPTLLLDSKELPCVVDTTKDISKTSQIRGESTSVLCSVTDFENKVMIVNEILKEEEESVVYDEKTPSNLDEKENRPTPGNPNMYKLQQITKSDTVAADNALSPGVFPVNRILQNMKKGIKVQIQKADTATSSFSKTKNFYQCQISASDKCSSFSKEASANSSSFLKVLKENDNIPRVLPNKASQGYTLREDCAGLIPDKRPSLGSAKLRPRVGIYSNESQSSFNIDDSISRLERRRKSELNNSRFQRGGPARSINKTLTQETCCVSTATSGNEVSMTSMKLAKQHSKVELVVECDQSMKKTNKATRSVTSSRASVERNTPLLKNQSKKGLKDLVSNRENQLPEEPLYTLILPLTSPKEFDFSRRTTKGDTELRKKSISQQQTKLNKTASRITLGKEDYSQVDRNATKTPTYQKKQWSDKETSASRPRSAVNQKKNESKMVLNKTLDVAINNILDDKANEKSQSSKILKNLLKGAQMDKSQKKGMASDKSDRDLKSKSMNKTLQERIEAKSPYLKKR